ncbi:glycosyltransferase family 4 protein [Persicimonas caeni]|uniref:Glycosyltransferase family 4 protein n=1 Tax=Persicimonas caeni TaxID=2292766 RepID=A0A4Y6PW95_PERCE|nr:glycosyltransferase family 1 protein [Persicimonas caeni]QDG52596.1 glycosyltransferase family 4 protein [Persicimonas caeni]QED33818.1 glycosyltransferase family 4 protein [Persicimonas caeni]
MPAAHSSHTDACVMLDARYISDQSSGIGRYTENLIEQLLELDDTLRLKLITHPSRPRPFESPRVSCQTYAAAPNSLRTRFLLTKSIDFRGVDLFHSPFNILPADVPVPCIFTLHDIMWLLDKNYCTDSWWRKLVTGTFYQQLIPRSAAQATRILTVSHHSRRSIEDYFPQKAGRVHVTYNGVDPFFRPMAPEKGWPLLSKWLTPRSRFVLVVGQGSPYKNHAGALAGFIEAFRHDPDVYFVLVRRLTRGPATRLKQLMADPDVASRIIQLDYVTGDELRALYSLAHAFLFPSLYEGFGLPALEAMSCGTPVVTSTYGAPGEVAGPAALTADPESPSELAGALRKLFDDDEFWQQQRQRGLEHAAKFTWRKCAQDTLSIYRQTLEGVE